MGLSPFALGARAGLVLGLELGWDPWAPEHVASAARHATRDHGGDLPQLPSAH